MELQRWVFPLQFFEEPEELGEAAEEGRDDDIARATFERTGAGMMGKRMFENKPASRKGAAGGAAVPHVSLRRDARTSRDWVREQAGPVHASATASRCPSARRAAAGDRDVRITGGSLRAILEYVNAGLIDEFSIALSPVLFGSGVRLFEGVDARRVSLVPDRAEPTQRVTHLTYAVRRR